MDLLVDTTMNKEIIDQKIEKCRRQQRMDNVLTLISAVATTAIFILIYRNNHIMLLLFLMIGWLVNLGVMFHCRRVWSLRINRWEALWKWCDLVESVTLLDGPLLSLPKSGGITEEILRRLPISS